MNETASKRSTILAALVALSSVAALTFALLWLRERGRKPTQAEAAKPVEIVREVPKEVIRVVPATLSGAQQFAIDFAAEFHKAPLMIGEEGAFLGLDSIAIEMHSNEAVRRVVSDDRLKNKFELVLRRHGIRLDDLDDDAPVWLLVTFDGLWDKDEGRLTYSHSMSMNQFVTIERKRDFCRTSAEVWRKSSVGYAGKNVAEKAILDAVEGMAESFANKFLAAKDKEKPKEKGL